MNEHDIVISELIPGLRLVCDNQDMLQNLADLLGYENTEALKAQLYTLLDVYSSFYTEELKHE